MLAYQLLGAAKYFNFANWTIKQPLSHYHTQGLF